MKKLIYSLILLLGTTLLISSCSKDEINSFEGSYAINFVQKTSSYSFLENTSSEFTAEIPIRIIGDTVNLERYFNVEVVADSLTTASPEQYEVLQGIVSAGDFSGNLPLKVFNFKALDTTEVSVHLRITDSKDFKKGNTESVDHVFTWTNKVLVPAWTYYRHFFCRVPSTAAYRAFVASTGMTSFTLNDYRELGPTGAQVKGTQFGDYIRKYNQENPGAPLLHDDGPNAGQEIIPIN